MSDQYCEVRMSFARYYCLCLGFCFAVFLGLLFLMFGSIPSPILISVMIVLVVSAVFSLIASAGAVAWTKVTITDSGITGVMGTIGWSDIRAIKDTSLGWCIIGRARGPGFLQRLNLFSDQVFLLKPSMWKNRAETLAACKKFAALNKDLEQKLLPQT
ncbi:MAG: hypothetical protein AB1705_17125 [Verrucomicrobiota bacterium]